jgi:hypothetical protein
MWGNVRKISVGMQAVGMHLARKRCRTRSRRRRSSSIGSNRQGWRSCGSLFSFQCHLLIVTCNILETIRETFPKDCPSHQFAYLIVYELVKARCSFLQ